MHGRNFPGHFGACYLGWRRYILLGSFMARLRGLMVTGTWIDRRLIQLQLEFYVTEDNSVWLVVEWEVYRVAIAMHSRACTSNFAPLCIGFRLNSEAMSRQRGTPRRASSGRAKTQRGCSAPVPTDYEPHISTRVQVLVEAWENKVLNHKLSTGEEDDRINHYWMLKNMLCNLAEEYGLQLGGSLDCSSLHENKNR